MLNEFYQITTALEKSLGSSIVAWHPSVDPMSKNANLLLVKLSFEAKPASVSFVCGEQAGSLLRIKHGSEGSSFPGFNLPLPLRQLPKLLNAECIKKLVDLIRVLKDKKSSVAAIAGAARNLFNNTSPTKFTDKQSKQFWRSVVELVGWLNADFSTEGANDKITNFRKLLNCVKSPPDLNTFAVALADRLITVQEANRTALEFFIETLYGCLDWSKNNNTLGSSEYQKEKADRDKKLKRAIYLDVADSDQSQLPVADPRTGELINRHLVKINAPVFTPESRQRKDNGNKSTCATAPYIDAFTGTTCEIPTTFPAPKLAELGNVRLFAVNTEEVASFARYGLDGCAMFKTSRSIAERMQNALLYIANEKQTGKTCRPIPSNRKGKSDLLIAYLEEDPDAPDPLADLFGGESQTIVDADFSATIERVMMNFTGRVSTNPNQRIRLIAITAIDKANKQVSLNRSYTVREVVDAAKFWQAGAANCPPVSLPFFDKQERKLIYKDRTVPSPLEIAIALNRVWVSNPDAGFRQEFQRIVSVSDAYDIFIAPDIVRSAKTRFALGVLLSRMRHVFAAAGTLKATSSYKVLGESVRWQVLKATSLIGIFLHQQGKKHEVFMKETVYQVGRLLALADSLHFQYCKHVRTSEEMRKTGKIDAPSELLGNAMFNTALDDPKRALARLAERIKPYKGWADTYFGEEEKLVHWVTHQMGDCEKQLDLTKLPYRMQDVQKAELLLGYLADHVKSEKEERGNYERRGEENNE